jgi:hypothetical protein
MSRISELFFVGSSLTVWVVRCELAQQMKNVLSAHLGMAIKINLMNPEVNAL